MAASGKPADLMGNRLLVMAVSLLALGLPKSRAAEMSRVVIGETAYLLHQWTQSDGLPDDSIRALLAASDGYLWIATANGLCRFDGTRFTSFPDVVSPGSGVAECLSLAESPEGDLWIGTSKGVMRRADFRFVPYTGAWPFASRRIASLACTSNGNLYAGTTGGIAVRLPDSVDFSCAETMIDVGDVRSLCAFGGGNIWAGTTTGLWKWKSRGRSWTLWPGTEGRVGTSITRSGDQLAVVLDGRPCLVKNDEVEALPFEPISSTVEGFATFDDLENLWFAAGDQCLRFRGDRETPPVRLAIPDVEFTGLVHDVEGNLWIGTRRSGLYCLRRARVEALTTRDGLPDGNVRCVVEDSRGRLWFGTDEGLLTKTFHFGALGAGRELSIAYTHDGLAAQKVTALAEDAFGRMWVGTDGTIHLIDVSGNVHPLEHEADSLGKVRCLTKGASGSIWIGRSRGLSFVSKAAYRYTERPAGSASIRMGPMRHVESLAGIDVWSIACFGDRIWVATAGEGVLLVRQTGDHVEIERRIDEFRSRNAGALCQSDHDTLWIGFEGGLARYSIGADRCFIYHAEHGMPEEVINELISDGNGNLWFGSNSGVHRASLASLNACASGERSKVALVSYGEFDGLPSEATHGSVTHPAAALTKKHGLWFATARGAARFDLADLTEPRTPRQPVVETVRVNGQSVGIPDNLQIPPESAHSVAFEFNAPPLFPHENIRFRYRLLPHEPDWAAAPSTRVALYNDLRAGTHRFEVQAVRDDAETATRPAAFEFRIQRPWFQQPWGIALLACVPFMTLFILRKGLQLRSRRTEIAERDRFAQVLHDDLGNRFHDLRAAAAKGDGTTLITKLSEAEQAVRDHIWYEDRACDTTKDLLERGGDFAFTKLSEAGVRCRLDFPDPLPSFVLPRDTRQALFLAIKEAVCNSVKHSGATTFGFGARMDGAYLVLSLEDDGAGCDLAGLDGKPRACHGLRHMKSRLESLNVAVSFHGSVGKGMAIHFKVRTSKPALS